jgi:hypothetical protein
MSVDIDSLVGSKMNMLTLLREGERRGKYKKRTVVCLCECGGEVEISLDQFVRERSVSCGCYQKSIMRDRATHSLSKSAEYKVWQGMKGRCHNPSHVDYYNYGARGVTVSEEWMNSFETFITDMGNRPTPTSTIERVDGLLGYCKENCCWIEKAEQSKNRRRPCEFGTSPNYQIKHDNYLRRVEKRSAKAKEENLLEAVE